MAAGLSGRGRRKRPGLIVFSAPSGLQDFIALEGFSVAFSIEKAVRNRSFKNGEWNEAFCRQ